MVRLYGDLGETHLRVIYIVLIQKYLSNENVTVNDKIITIQKIIEKEQGGTKYRWGNVVSQNFVLR